MGRNDPNALAASVTPQILSELASERYVGNTPADRLANGTKWVADSLAPSSGFYVVAQRPMSQDQAILDVYFEKEGATRRFRLMKIGDEWKLGGIFLAGGTDDEPLAVPRFWP